MIRRLFVAMTTLLGLVIFTAAPAQAVPTFTCPTDPQEDCLWVFYNPTFTVQKGVFEISCGQVVQDEGSFGSFYTYEWSYANC